MKRLIPLLLCLALLSGCAFPLSNDYLSVREHYDPYTYKEESTEYKPPPEVVDHYYDMRNAFSKPLKDGLEEAEVVCRSYRGDLEQDIGKLHDYFTKSLGITAYLIDTINFEIAAEKSEDDANGSAAESTDRIVKMTVVYRRSADEYIDTYRENARGINRLKAAMLSFEPSLTIQVSGFRDEDFAETLSQYCTENAELFPEFPKIEILLFPDEGNVRVIEAHFKYGSINSTKQMLQEKASAVYSELESFTTSVVTNAHSLEQPTVSDYLSEACEELKDNFIYEEIPNATVYSLLHNGVGNSRCFAAVCHRICREVSINCTTVHGTKDGEDYYWCIVKTDEEYRHVDLRRAVVENAPLLFLTDDQMEGYEWDRTKYPPCVDAQELPQESQ